MNSTPSPFSQSSTSSTANFRVRSAKIDDLSALATLLTECFHPPVGWMYWLNPVLRFGIYEDLRSRLQNASPHYLCLVTGVQSARNLALFSPKLATYPDVTESSNSILTNPEELVGTIELTLRASSLFGAQYPYISNLAISPAYRRQGLARQLLQQCEPVAKRWGYREIYLHVMENNQGAIALYRNCGYHLHSTEANLGSWLWERPHRLLLRKSL